MPHRKPRSRRRRRRPKASSHANQLTPNLMKLQRAAERRSLSVSGWTRKARSSIPSIVWSLWKRGTQSVTEKTTQLVTKLIHIAGQVRLSQTQMRGHTIPGERSNNGVGRGLDNNGAKNGESGDHHSQPGAAGANNLPLPRDHVLCGDYQRQCDPVRRLGLRWHRPGTRTPPPRKVAKPPFVARLDPAPARPLPRDGAGAGRTRGRSRRRRVAPSLNRRS